MPAVGLFGNNEARNLRHPSLLHNLDIDKIKTMAVLYGNESPYLRKKYNSYYILVIIIFVVVLSLSIYATSFNLFNFRLTYITYPVAIISFLGLLWYKKALATLGVKATDYKKGLRGEKTVRQTLSQLPDNFTVFQDLVLEQNQGNIDFVVVGPTGIFTIEAKNRDGNFTCKFDQLLRNGKQLEKDDVSQSMNQALAIHNYLLSQGLDIFVTPILVYNQFAEIHFGKSKIHHVNVIGINWLQKTILETESRLNLDLDQIKQTLTKKLQSPN